MYLNSVITAVPDGENHSSIPSRYIVTKGIGEGIFETFCFEVDSTITTQQAETVADWIKTENRTNLPHMLEITGSQVEQYISLGLAIVIRSNGNMVGFAKAMPLDDQGDPINLESLHEFQGKIYYEIGSIIVDDSFKGRKIGHILTEYMFKKFSDNNVFLVTNVQRVMTIMQKLGYEGSSRGELDPDFLRIVEKPGALLHNDIVFRNLSSK